MNEQEVYLNLPEVGEVAEMEKFEYDSAATPYRTTQVYRISYDTNISKDKSQSE